MVIHAGQLHTMAASDCDLRFGEALEPHPAIALGYAPKGYIGHFEFCLSQVCSMPAWPEMGISAPYTSMTPVPSYAEVLHIDMVKLVEDHLRDWSGVNKIQSINCGFGGPHYEHNRGRVSYYASERVTLPSEARFMHDGQEYSLRFEPAPFTW